MTSKILGSRWFAAALWGVFIELLTSWPSPPTFGVPSGGDTFAHVGLYAVFGFLVIRAAQVGKPSARSMILTLAALAVWAALDEAHQVLIPGRTPSFGDWTSDVFGVATGLAVQHARMSRIPAKAA